MKARTNEATWLEKEKRWVVQIMKDGQRKRFYSSLPSKKGKIEAEKKADEWLRTSVHDDNRRVKELYEEFIEDMRRNDMYTTQYEGYGRREIIPCIGHKRIGDVTELDCQNILTVCYRKGFAKHTLQNIRGCITSFLRYCRAGKYTLLRPEILKVNRKAPTREKRSLQPEELKTLFASEATEWYGSHVKDWYIYMYRFIVSTGLRPGEACGLRRQDIHEDGTVTLCESFNNQKQMTAGKNENARRTFRMNAEAERAWNDQKKMLIEEGIVSQWAFPRRDNGEITTQKKLSVEWRRYQAHNKITYTTLYELRHTYVSINKEMPEDLLKSQVGHSPSMQTRSVYSHQLQGEMDKAARYSTEAFLAILNK